MQRGSHRVVAEKPTQGRGVQAGTALGAPGLRLRPRGLFAGNSGLWLSPGPA